MVKKAREIGFFIVNVVTNGTITLNIDGVDIIFLSLDGLKDAHNLIRENTFDIIINNLAKTENQNICIYMAINQLNYTDIRGLAQLAKDIQS